MVWFFGNPSNNELGEYLPEDEAQPYEQSEPIQALSQSEAQETCKEIASEYGGTEPYAEPVKGSNKDYNCKFKLWG
ncbi:MAG: hypothetical protein ACFKPT_09285 [Gloeotrichia echinulata GP01]